MSVQRVCVADFEEQAKKILPKAVYDYYCSGADEQNTLADNVAAFNRWRLVPRVLRDVSTVDLSVSLLGHRLNMPICVAATAMQRMAHPEGETATARACRAVGTGMMLSSWATSTIEEVMSAALGGVMWLQLYIYKDRELTLSLVRRAEEAGYKAIFVTVDTPYLGRRRDDMRNRFKLPPHLSMSNFSSASLAFSEGNYGNDSGLAVYVANAIDPSLSWDDITWIKQHTCLPVIVKGVVNGEDATQAVNYGVDGIVVSNHGARQLDGVPATLDVLEEVVQAVQGRCDVYMDGGVRRGTDVLKALALGAKAVFIGRPVLWGLACQGEQGVIEMLELLQEELRLAMALSGNTFNGEEQGRNLKEKRRTGSGIHVVCCRSVSEVSRSLVRKMEFTSRM
ncbi:2-Hydroxyacid oxidase 1 isoform X1 [Gasterosteus aculeatus]|uniref:(S)-2-hydroxy-acid oxidase n=1 Tax=Gasterosteus aculeatus aculeatus TaxID=481459 RepID=A0AAQ4PAA8_GASAC|nr:hydroxyacid oxidase 1 isoform X1 [Gasterosteus aculeatus aculeatus]